MTRWKRHLFIKRGRFSGKSWKQEKDRTKEEDEEEKLLLVQLLDVLSSYLNNL